MQNLSYIVLLQACGREHFLLWQSGGNAPDMYVLQPGKASFLAGATRADLLAGAAKLGCCVADQEPEIMDMDRSFRMLAALRPERCSSTRTCAQLLNGWNTLEDMARSIGIPMDVPDPEEKASLDLAYEKLFYGNNLPALTPEGERFNPLFTARERQIMRRYLRRLWHQIKARSRQFSMY
ncbi:hypothetical protein [Azovibrio restrictus]|uniref:hypothetical protein n=1 Tax=Azovibrio restrictus TaxID=146938 RepID=UPI0026F1DA9A|nr:hypothetical protein [Azovibrio restrictus]MDD3483973.1 hypothetical protein [Azovibrio restrictus]